ncbi:Protein CBG10643 [Caenorhabditis briggsae]|uniref:Protein CBG10643 n=1 Tax=Caenorhabditis briggsae TaxID=6238 RepID=A8XBI3_CAEBR|nr:Protein CBG10643 [Caenorhabditis briggsae]CAP29998.2 Protein CBG10643 [Caenorhabditis briggsae]
MSFNEFNQAFEQFGQVNGGDFCDVAPINNSGTGQDGMSHQLSSGCEGLIPDVQHGHPPSIGLEENDTICQSLIPICMQAISQENFHSNRAVLPEHSPPILHTTIHVARGIPVQIESISRADVNQKRVAETGQNQNETHLQKAPRYVEPKFEEFEKSLKGYTDQMFFNPESLFNNFEVSQHSLFLEQPMNYKEERVTHELDDDTLRNVGAPAFNYGYGGFPIPSLPGKEDTEYHEEGELNQFLFKKKSPSINSFSATKWIKKREIEKKQLLMGTVDRLQMEVNKKRSEIEEIIENTEKQTRDDAKLLERKSIYFFVEETDAQKKDRKWRSKFLSHFGNVKDLPLDQLMVRLKNALREKKQLQKRRESKEIIKKVEEDIRVAERFLGRASTYFINEQELEQAFREMRPIIQFDNKLKRCLNERDTLWKEIMETNCVKTTLNHQFTDVLNMEKDTEQWRPSKVVSIPWVFRFQKSSGLYHLTVDFEPLVPVTSGFIATVRPTMGTKKLHVSTFKYFDIWDSTRIFEKTIIKEEIEKFLEDGNLSMKLKVCVKSGNDLRERLEFNKSEERDTCVVVEDQHFYVSKMVNFKISIHFHLRFFQELASLSPVFDRMFFGGFEESRKSEITFQGIFASDFHDFLEFCFNGGRLNNGTVRGIADVAEMFDIEAVRLMCINFISQNREYSTKEKRQFGKEFDIPELKNYVRQQ